MLFIFRYLYGISRIHMTFLASRIRGSQAGPAADKVGEAGTIIAPLGAREAEEKTTSND
jgi:hypothetical protein